MARGAVWGLVGAVLLAASPSAVAHTREKERIDALSLEVTRQDALLAQRVKDAMEANERLREGIKERAEHARFLEGRLAALKTDLETAVAGVRDAAGKAASEKAAALELRLDSQAATRAQAEADERARLRGELQALSSTVSQFRTSLTSFAAAVDGRFQSMRAETQAVRAEVSAVRAELERDRQASEQRLQGLLKVVSDENLKLRQAVARLAGEPAPQRTHVVKAGDNLFGIAKQYGITVEQLKKANPELAKPNAVVHPGSKVVIPAP